MKLTVPAIAEKQMTLPVYLKAKTNKVMVSGLMLTLTFYFNHTNKRIIVQRNFLSSGKLLQLHLSYSLQSIRA